ncbi:MAG: sulfatase-like hydrolase/transferase [Verrucomicrobia bacterium]|nr:sulfatase-like hydrolase/transferase [Verrucomicrobiota bacterium]
MKTILLALLSFLAVSHSAFAADRPNVLMIAVDDLNDWVGYLGGHPDVKTPNLDRLAQRGLVFANAHCPAPVCNPSRAALMTGRLPAHTGIYGNEVRWHEALPDVPTIPQHFKAQGYHVAGGGKINHHTPGYNRASDWHMYFDQVFDSHYQVGLARGDDMSKFAWPPGFPLSQIPAVKAFARPPANPNEFDWGPWDATDEAMGDGQLVEWAVKFLAAPPSRPFFLAPGIYRPHLPFYAPRKYFEMYPLDRITLPVVKADDLDDVPAGGQRMAADRRGDLELVSRAVAGVSRKHHLLRRACRPPARRARGRPGGEQHHHRPLVRPRLAFRRKKSPA